MLMSMFNVMLLTMKSIYNIMILRVSFKLLSFY